MSPPTSTDFSSRDLPPQLFRLDLCISKQSTVATAIQEDRIVVYAVIFQHLLQLRPDRIVTPLIFNERPRLKCHQERFANHENWSLAFGLWSLFDYPVQN